jgi:hypothetical protein
MEKEPHPLSLSLLARVCLIIGSRVYCICLDVACSLPRTRKRKSHTSTPLAKNLPGTNERTALFYSMYSWALPLCWRREKNANDAFAVLHVAVVIIGCSYVVVWLWLLLFRAPALLERLAGNDSF